MNAHNLPIASSEASPRPMHPQAAVGTDAATLYLDDAMLADVLPAHLAFRTKRRIIVASNLMADAALAISVFMLVFALGVSL